MEPDQVAKLDQAGADLKAHLAPLLGGYYTALKANKIPAALAAELVVAFQEFIIQREEP